LEVELPLGYKDRREQRESFTMDLALQFFTAFHPFSPIFFFGDVFKRHLIKAFFWVIF